MTIVLQQAKLELIPVEWLKPGQYQPRCSFDEEKLNELAKSIQSQGLIEPLVVRNIAFNCYEIIAGERRWRASIIAKLEKVPCLIGTYTDQQAAAVSMVENIQRQDLNLIEEARGYTRLIKDFKFTQEAIAQLVGKSRSHITNILRLLTLPLAIQNMLIVEQLSFGHARVLIGLDQPEQKKLAHTCYQEQWSVRQLEQAVKKSKKKDFSALKFQDLDITHLETRLSELLGSPVQFIQASGESGWLKIQYFDYDTLSGLLERMGMCLEE